MVGCRKSVRYKLHKNVDSQIGPPLDVEMHREESPSIPMKPNYPKAPRTLWMIRPTARRMRANC